MPELMGDSKFVAEDPAYGWDMPEVLFPEMEKVLFRLCVLLHMYWNGMIFLKITAFARKCLFVPMHEKPVSDVFSRYGLRA